jgi:hypothetical protein
MTPTKLTRTKTEIGEDSQKLSKLGRDSLAYFLTKRPSLFIFFGAFDIGPSIKSRASIRNTIGMLGFFEICPALFYPVNLELFISFLEHI